MLKRFHLENFRCFRELELELAPFNLIAGKNNVGKTALLEALLVFANPTRPAAWEALNRSRGWKPHSADTIETFGWLFHRHDLEHKIVLSGVDDQNRSQRLEIGAKSSDHGAGYDPDTGILDPANLSESTLEYFFQGIDGAPHEGTIEMIGRTSPAWSAQGSRVSSSIPSLQIASARSFGREEIVRFSRLEEAGEDQPILETLRLVEPRLKRLTISVSREATSIRGDLGIGRLVPLAFMGEGIERILSLSLFIASSKDSLVLIDEIENGLHHSVTIPVWRALAELARKVGAQIVATTHSWEQILAAHRAFQEGPRYDLALHRLDRLDQEIQVVTYDQESLQTSLDLQWEVR